MENRSIDVLWSNMLLPTFSWLISTENEQFKLSNWILILVALSFVISQVISMRLNETMNCVQCNLIFIFRLQTFTIYIIHRYMRQSEYNSFHFFQDHCIVTPKQYLFLPVCIEHFQVIDQKRRTQNYWASWYKFCSCTLL